MKGLAEGTIARTGLRLWLASEYAAVGAQLVMFVVKVIRGVLSLQVAGRLAHAVDIVVVASRKWRVFRDYVPRVDKTGEVAENTEEDVNPGVCRTHATTDPHRKWG